MSVIGDFLQHETQVWKQQQVIIHQLRHDQQGQDDEITQDCIEKLMFPLSEERYDLIVGNTHTIGNDRLGKQLNMKLNDGEVLIVGEIMD